MDLIEEYRKQQTWRDWDNYLNFIPLKNTDNVLDLGSSVGNVSHLLAKKVKQVVGVDHNQEFVNFCNQNKLENEQFICASFLDLNLKSLPQFTGVWASFSLSYLPDPQRFLNYIYSTLPEGGWIALLDISCFISGNMNKNSKYHKVVKEFENNSYMSGVYDFDFGSRQNSLLNESGFNIIHFNDNVSDIELNFNGPARADVLSVWTARLERLVGLQKLLAEDYAEFKDEFLIQLTSKDHTQNENLKFTVAVK